VKPYQSNEELLINPISAINFFYKILSHHLISGAVAEYFAHPVIHLNNAEIFIRKNFLRS